MPAQMSGTAGHRGTVWIDRYWLTTANCGLISSLFVLCRCAELLCSFSLSLSVRAGMGVCVCVCSAASVVLTACSCMLSLWGTMKANLFAHMILYHSHGVRCESHWQAYICASEVNDDFCLYFVSALCCVLWHLLWTERNEQQPLDKCDRKILSHVCPTVSLAGRVPSTDIHPPMCSTEITIVYNCRSIVLSVLDLVAEMCKPCS